MATEQTTISSCCVSGHMHTGTPAGSFQTLYGLNTYVSPPANSKGTTGKQNTIVILSDIYGPGYINTQLVADEWAKQGWRVVLPDCFEGDPVPVEHIRSIHPKLRDIENKSLLEKTADTAIATVDVGPWLFRHREAVVRPLIEKFVQGIKDEPQTGKICAVGFCWGARYCLLLARDDSPVKIDAAVTYHASFVVEADVQGINSTPVAFFKGDKDWMFSNEHLDTLTNNLRPRLGDKLLVKLFPGGVHGFAVRGDDMVDFEVKQKEEANRDGINFTKKWFGEE